LRIKVCSSGDLALSEVLVWPAICQPGDNLAEWGRECWNPRHCRTCI